MDPTPPEQPKQPPTEQEPKEILLPKETARALGRGLRQQVFTETELATISANIAYLLETTIETPTRKWVSLIANSIDDVKKLLSDIEKADQVKLVPFEKNKSELDFEFFKENSPLEKPKPGEIILDEELSRRLISTLTHNFLNMLSPILGYAELIQKQPNDSPAIKEKAEVIREISALMLKKFTSITSMDKRRQIKLVTDNHGNTTISLVSSLPEKP